MANKYTRLAQTHDIDDLDDIPEIECQSTRIVATKGMSGTRSEGSLKTSKSRSRRVKPAWKQTLDRIPTPTEE